MYIVAIGWLFVVVCMAAAEAMSSSIAGALVTLLIYGLLPLGLFLWLVGTPQRRRNREGTKQTIAGASFTPGRRFEAPSRRPHDAD
jgi:hypothetical protein